MKQRTRPRSESSAAEPDLPKSPDRSAKFQPDMLWVPGDLAARRDLDWTVKILVALAMSYSDSTGHGLLLDNRRLAKFLGIEPQAVLRAIRRAEEQGLISRGGKKRRVIRAIRRSVTSKGIAITRRLMSAHDLDWRDRALLGLIAGLSKNSGYCYASNAWLAEQLGYDSRHVRRLLKCLLAKGWIRVWYSPDGRRRIAVTTPHGPKGPTTPHNEPDGSGGSSTNTGGPDCPSPTPCIATGDGLNVPPPALHVLQ